MRRRRCIPSLVSPGEGKRPSDNKLVLNVSAPGGYLCPDSSMIADRSGLIFLPFIEPYALHRFVLNTPDYL